MVYTIPNRGAPRPSLGNTLGSSISEGFQESFKPAIQQEYQRGRIQEALGGLKNIANDPNASPTDIATALISATAGIPGAEKYTGQLYDSLMRERNTRNYFGGQGQGQQQGGQQPQQPQQMQGGQAPQGNANPFMQNLGPRQQQNPFVNQPQGQGNAPGNQGTPQLGTLTVPQMQQIAQSRARALNDPNAYATEFQNLQRENEEARAQQGDVVNTQGLETKRQEDILKRDQQLRNFVSPKLAKGDTAPNSEELNDFMLIGERYDNLKNQPAQWYDATKKDFDRMMNRKTALEGVNNPGILTHLLRPGNQREQQLKRMEPIVQDLVKFGKEDYARETLANMYLSPTEIEMQIHPLNPQVKEEISKFPKAPYKMEDESSPLSSAGAAAMGVVGVLRNISKGPTGKGSYHDLQQSYPKLLDQDNSKVASFLQKNLNNDTSLLVMRDALGRDWRQFNDALNLAEKEGLQLTERQQAERAELTRPPIQSLPDMFTEWGRWIEYLRGNK